MPLLLQTIFRHISASQILEAHSWCYKNAPSGLHVPHEAHYQGQLLAVAGRLLVHQAWSIRNEVNAILEKALDDDFKGKEKEKQKDTEKGKLDFLLKRGSVKVGIELVASSDLANVREHASRSYAVTLGLSQYVVVHIYGRTPLDLVSPKQTDLLKKERKPHGSQSFRSGTTRATPASR